MKQLVITGTDTSVGKTLVTAGLFRHLIRNERDAAVMKPVQTGVAPSDRGATSDLASAGRAIGIRFDEKTRARWMPYCFEAACSPHLAARREGVSIDADRLVADARRLAAEYECLLVEGAGGLMVPLNDAWLFLDFMRELAWPVLVVADNRLGMINHTLLTLRALRAAELTIAGVVVNNASRRLKREAYLREENIKAVERYGRARILAEIPRVTGKFDVSSRAWKKLDPLFAHIADQVFCADRPRQAV